MYYPYAFSNKRLALTTFGCFVAVCVVVIVVVYPYSPYTVLCLLPTGQPASKLPLSIDQPASKLARLYIIIICMKLFFAQLCLSECLQ